MVTSPKAKVRGGVVEWEEERAFFGYQRETYSHPLNKAVSKVFGFFVCFPLGSGKSAASQVLGMAGSR